MDVLAAVERVTGRPVHVARRPQEAEPAVLVCDPSRALAELGWKPRCSELDVIVRDAWSARGTSVGGS